MNESKNILLKTTNHAAMTTAGRAHGEKQKKHQDYHHQHSSLKSATINQHDIRPYDILCGRDKTVFNRAGNRRFRVSISINIARYDAAKTKAQKTEVIKFVCNVLKKDVGMRFLKTHQQYQQYGGQERGEGEYIELSEKEIRKKVGHALRDMSVAWQELNEKRNQLQLPFADGTPIIAMPTTTAASTGASASATATATSGNSPSTKRRQQQHHEYDDQDPDKSNSEVPTFVSFDDDVTDSFDDNDTDNNYDEQRQEDESNRRLVCTTEISSNNNNLGDESFNTALSRYVDMGLNISSADTAQLLEPVPFQETKEQLQQLHSLHFTTGNIRGRRRHWCNTKNKKIRAVVHNNNTNNTNNTNI